MQMHFSVVYVENWKLVSGENGNGRCEKIWLPSRYYVTMKIDPERQDTFTLQSSQWSWQFGLQMFFLFVKYGFD